jgi:hypothetical protein
LQQAKELQTIPNRPGRRNQRLIEKDGKKCSANPNPGVENSLDTVSKLPLQFYARVVGQRSGRGKRRHSAVKDAHAAGGVFSHAPEVLRHTGRVLRFTAGVLCAKKFPLPLTAPNFMAQARFFTARSRFCAIWNPA